MKFAAVALMGAIYVAEQVEGRRGKKDYDITRAYAMCSAVDSGTRRLAEGDIEGKVKLAQVSSGEMSKPIQVWSNFMNVPEQTGEEGYDFEVFTAADCGGTSEGDFDAMYTDGWGECARNIHSKIDLDLQMMMDNSYSIALRDNMNSVISCCNIMSMDAPKIEDGLLGDYTNRNSRADDRGSPQDGEETDGVESEESVSTEDFVPTGDYATGLLPSGMLGDDGEDSMSEDSVDSEDDVDSISTDDGDARLLDNDKTKKVKTESVDSVSSESSVDGARLLDSETSVDSESEESVDAVSSESSVEGARLLDSETSVDSESEESVDAVSSESSVDGARLLDGETSVDSESEESVDAVSSESEESVDGGRLLAGFLQN